MVSKNSNSKLIPGYVLRVWLIIVLILYNFFLAEAQERYPLLKLPIGHNEEIVALDISKNGKLIATAGKDRIVIIWDAKTGKPIRNFTTPDNITRILFTGDGKNIVVAEGSPLPLTKKKLSLWDVKKADRIKGYDLSADNNIALSPINNMMMLSPLDMGSNPDDNEEDNKTNAYIYNINDASTINNLKIGFNFDIQAMTMDNAVFNFIAYENKVLIISTKTNFHSTKAEEKYLIDIWNTEDLSKPVKTIQSKERITSISPCASLGFFATVSGNNINVWNVKSGTLIDRFTPAGEEITNTGFSSEGDRLFCYSNTNKSKQIIQVWKINGHKEILNKIIQNNKGNRKLAGFLPDGKHFLVVNEKQVDLFNINGNIENELKGLVINTRNLYFASDNRFLIATHETGETKDKLAKMMAPGGELEKMNKNASEEDKKFMDEYIKKMEPKMKTYVNNLLNIPIWDLQLGTSSWQPLVKNEIVINGKHIKESTDTISADKNLILVNQSKREFSKLIEFVNTKGNNADDDDNGGPEMVNNMLNGMIEKQKASLPMQKNPDNLTSKEKLLINKKLSDTIRLITLDSANWIMINKAGYYKCSKDAAGLLHYISKDDKVISFEQLDLQFNRPDIILKSLNSKNESLIDAYKKTYLNRLDRYNLREELFDQNPDIPEANFVNEEMEYNQTKKEIKLSVHGAAGESPIILFNVWINEVPLFGIEGQRISNAANKIFDTTITVSLSEGKNKIETSVSNTSGFDSYRYPLYLNYIPQAASKKRTWFIGMAVDKYADPKHNNLKYSVEDIKSLASELKKKVKTEFIVDTLFNSNFTQENIDKLKQKLMTASIDDKVIFVYSGHGLLQEGKYYLPTASMNAADFNKPASKAISYRKLEDLLNITPARNKLFMIDACHSGIYDPGMEVIDTTTTSEIMDELFTYVGRGTGATIIASSAGIGKSFEPNDNSFKHGFFTQAVLNAIKNFSSVTVSELKKYIITEVPLISNHHQLPNTRSENREADFIVW